MPHPHSNYHTFAPSTPQLAQLLINVSGALSQPTRSHDLNLNPKTRAFQPSRHRRLLFGNPPVQLGTSKVEKSLNTPHGPLFRCGERVLGHPLFAIKSARPTFGCSQPFLW